MARFLPAQICRWTGGQLVQSPENASSSEHYYRGISTDTRNLRSGEIFLALRGEHFDGHDYVGEAIRRGAGLLVLEERSEQAMDIYHRLSRGEALPDLLLIPDTLKTYQAIAAGFRQTLLASLIAVTGSVGKTTTRRMLSATLSPQMKLHETRENENNLIGVPLTILQASDSDDVILVELGMDRRGEIATLSEISKPDIAILTNIGYSHAEYLGSRENILKEKTDILKGMRSNGLVIMNGQDPYMSSWAEAEDRGISIWSVYDDPAEARESRQPAFWAEEVRLGREHTSFVLRSQLVPELKHEIRIPAPGKHLIRSALFALAAAYALGLDMKRAAEGCGGFVNTNKRQQLVEVAGLSLMDDSYNAAPESIQAALETLELLAKAGQRRLVCLGGVRELGRYETAYHRELGEELAEFAFERVYLVGKEMRSCFESYRAAAPGAEVFWYENSAEMVPDFLDQVLPGDLVLIKGSRYYEMEKIRRALEQKTAAQTGEKNA